MKYSTFTLILLSLSGAIAQPHKQHQHQHQKHHEKRDVVWTTTWEVVTETLSITTTVWIDGDETSVPSTSTTSVVHPTLSTQSPAEFHQSPTKSSTSTALITPTSTSTSVAPYIPPPSTSSVYVPPPPPTSTYVAPVEPTTTPVYVAPTTSQAPAVYVPPEPTTTAPAPASTTPPSSPPSSGGDCSSDAPCTGDITYYQAGLGACGVTTDGDKEKGVALPWEFMGTQSNGNPYCGKTITIEKDGVSIVATVIDKCMGCTGRSIDLTNLAFSSLGIDFAVGRTTATWYFSN